MTTFQSPDIQITTLRNGLRVASVHLPHLHLGHAALYLRAGPRFERVADHGLSHFCEHMLFRGAGPYRSAAALAQALEEVAGQLDAATYRDHVVYATAYAPRGLGRVLEVLGALVSAPAFRDIETERAIVLEELNELEDERGRDVDPDNHVRALLFGDAPLGRRIDGSRALVKRFGTRQLRRHHRQRYVARNMALVVAGPESPAAVTRQARKHLAALPPGSAARLVLPEASPPQLPRTRLVRNEGRQTELRLAYRTPGEVDPRTAALSIARRLLDDGMGSRLQGDLVERQGLAYELWADLDQGPDIGAFEFGASVAHHKVTRTVRALLDALRELAEQGPGPEELRRAKRRARWGLDAAIDAPAALGEWVGRGLLFDLNVDLDHARRQLQAVRAGQVASVLRQLLDPGYLSLAAVGMLGNRERARLRQELARQHQRWPR